MYKSSTSVVETTDHATDKVSADEEESSDCHNFFWENDEIDQARPTTPVYPDGNSKNSTPNMTNKENDNDIAEKNTNTNTPSNDKTQSSFSINLNICQKNGALINNKLVSHDHGKGLTRVSINREKNDTECIVGYDQNPANDQKYSAIRVNLLDNDECHEKEISFSYTQTRGRSESSTGMKFLHSYHIPFHKENTSYSVYFIFR
jgi:hypothetical protein